MPEYHQPDTNEIRLCYYCRNPLKEAMGGGRWVCGTPTKGVHYSIGEDDEIDYICIYETIDGYEYLAKHYLPNRVWFKKNVSELNIYDVKEEEVYSNFYPISAITINELMVDRITPENLVSKVKLYLLLS